MLGRIETAARALSRAQATWQAAVHASQAMPVRPVLDRARAVRRGLLLDLDQLVRHGVLEAAAVERCSTGSGRLAVAKTLKILVRLLRAEWDVVGTRTLIDSATVAEAERLSEDLLHAVPEHEAERIEAANAARHRAFAELLAEYDELRRALTYVRWRAGDVDRIAPSLYTKGRKRKVRAQRAVTATEAERAA